MRGTGRDSYEGRWNMALQLLLLGLASACASSGSSLTSRSERVPSPEPGPEPGKGSLRSFLINDEEGRPLDGRLILVATPQYEAVDQISSFEIRAGRVDCQIGPDLLQLACFVELPGDLRPRLCWVDYLYGAIPEPAPLIEMEVPQADMKITGHVVDAISKLPITEGEVELSAGEFARGSELTQRQDIRPDGSLRFEAQTHGNWWVTVRAPGYAPTKFCSYQMGLWEQVDRGNNPPLYPGRELFIRASGLDPGRRYEVAIQWKNANQATYPSWRLPIAEGQESRFTIPCAVAVVVELLVEDERADQQTLEPGDGPISIELRARAKDPVTRD